ncbi:MAG: hypothetical protein Q4G69_08710 [Planctomycetia bacterium]|nr:hypothetical protein [Planctomycetia bacterium]
MARKINVGIYGNTGAGKTAFLLRFFNELKKAYGDVKFYHDHCSDHVPDFLDSSNSHTLSESPDLWVKFQNSIPITGNRSPLKFSRKLSGNVQYELEFKDLRGEGLRKDLDDMNSASYWNDNIILEQIELCDVYLFMLDPTGLSGGDLPAYFKLDEDHLKEELERAQSLIQMIIKKRGNKNLPILFVQTHKDIIDQLDNNDQKRLSDWFGEVNQILIKEYRPLQNVQPESLTDPKKTSRQISSTTEKFEETQIIPLIGSLLDLVEDYRVHFRSDRKRSFCFVLLILLIGAALIFGIPAIYKWEQKQELSKPLSVSKEDQVTDLEINIQRTTISDLMIELDTLSEDTVFPKTMKKAWDFIDRIRQDPKRREMKAFVALQKEFQKAGKRIEKNILDDNIPANKRLKFAEALTGLYSEKGKAIPAEEYFNMAEIANTVKQLIENQLLEKMRESVKQYTEMQSVPEDLNQDLCKILNETKDQIGKLEISDSDFVRFREIDRSLLFLKGRIKEKRYSTKISASGSARPKETITFEITGQSEKNALTLKNENAKKANSNGLLELSIPKEKDPSTFTVPLARKIPDWKVTRWNNDKGSWSELSRSGSDNFISKETLTLADLGMHLIFKEKTSFIFDFKESGKDEKIAQLTFQFQPNEKIPDLLWEAVSKENKNAKKIAN